MANCHEYILGIQGQALERQLTLEEEKSYSEANTIFLGDVVGVLTEHL
jgi:hypothetical protein